MTASTIQEGHRLPLIYVIGQRRQDNNGLNEDYLSPRNSHSIRCPLNKFLIQREERPRGPSRYLARFALIIHFEYRRKRVPDAILDNELWIPHELLAKFLMKVSYLVSDGKRWSF